MLYFIGWSIFFVFLRVTLGVKVVGRQNVPSRGPFILVSNHVSYLDPLLLGTSVYRSLNYMARENLFKRPCFGRVMKGLHAFPVKRSRGDLKAIKDALAILEKGKPLVIFPEGTRSKDRSLRPAKPGLGFIVSKADVPVIPAYIEGSFDALPKGAGTFKRHPVKVCFGSRVKFSNVNSDKHDKRLYQDISDEVMREIAKLKAMAEE